jgi:hypothetical protein
MKIDNMSEEEKAREQERLDRIERSEIIEENLKQVGLNKMISDVSRNMIENDMNRVDLLRHRVNTYIELSPIFDDSTKDIPFDKEWLKEELFNDYIDDFIDEDFCDDDLTIDFKPSTKN